MSTHAEAGWIVGGNLVDPAAGTSEPNPGIFVSGGRIDAIGIPDGSEGNDAILTISDEHFILPGLVNLHDHLTYRATIGAPRLSMEAPVGRQAITAVRNAHLSLARGITTIRELGSRHGINHTIREAVSSGGLVGPQVLSAGQPLSITGGHAWYLGREVDGVDSIRSAVRELAKGGAHWVKVMASHDPIRVKGGQATQAQYSSEELRAVVEEAHALGLRVAAHAMGTIAIQRCIDAGVDTVEHGVYLNQDQADQMRESGIVLVPTISSYQRTSWPMYKRGADWADRHQVLEKPHLEAAEVAIAAGVEIGIGTDSIGEYVEEMELLVSCGMTAAGAIRAATTVGAATLDASDEFGAVRTGARADLIIVEGDPLQELASLRAIHCVVTNGVLLTPSDFRLSLMSKDLAPEL